MPAFADLLDFQIAPSLIFAAIGVISLVMIAIIAFFGFDD